MDPKLFKAAMTVDLHFLESLNEDDNSNFLCQVTPKKNTVLYIAAEFNQLEFVRAVTHRCPLLFQSGNSNGDTPLHVAAKVGCCEIVDECHKKKELLRIVNVDKDTALHCATRNGHYQSVKLLLEADLELSNLINNADESPLYLATSKGLTDISELILNASPSSSSHAGPNGITALHEAVYYESQNFIKILLEKRPNIIREQDNLGWTPLHYAALLGLAELVRLLNHDSFVAYILDNDGESALHIASHVGHINVIEEIIKCCPDVCDLTDKKGQTALHVAVLGRQGKVVKYILETPQLKCLINEPDKGGNTPLHISVIYKQYRIIYMLAQEERVDIKATNKENLTALTILIQNGERGFAVEKARYLLKNYIGSQGVRLWINASELKQPPILEVRSSSSLNTESMDNIAEEPDFGKRNALETNLLVAMLVATVTFAAGCTMPGGYKSDGPDQGLANLTTKVAFKAFVIFDTTAFLFSVTAVGLQLDSSENYKVQIRYMNLASMCTGIAIIGMVLAFVFGMHVVLAKSIGLAITAYVMAGCLALSYTLVSFLDPTANLLSCIDWYRKYVLHLLFHYGVI
ncbi:ankyrin repeat-containing protein At2g01680 [Fagus crenata]